MGRAYRDRRHQGSAQDRQAGSGRQANGASDDPPQGERCPGGEEARSQHGAAVEDRF